MVGSTSENWMPISLSHHELPGSAFQVLSSGRSSSLFLYLPRLLTASRLPNAYDGGTAAFTSPTATLGAFFQSQPMAELRPMLARLAFLPELAFCPTVDS